MKINHKRGFARLVNFNDAISSHTKSVSSKLTTGFTLIELLVVVAIIGILASVILGEVTKARTKGSDVAVKVDLGNARPEATNYSDSNPAHPTGTALATAGATSCTTANSIFALDIVMASQITAAQSTGSGIISCMNTLGISGTWAITANLKSDPTQFWCVDSSGKSQISGVASPDTTQAYADSVVTGGVCH